MANQTTIGELVIDLKTRTEALEKGLETAKKKLQEVEHQNEQVQNSNSKLDASFIAMSAAAVASLAKIKSAVSDGINKYNSYINSMKALQKTAKATDNSMSDIKDTIEDVNKLKLMDESDLNSSIKNLLTYGFTIEQTSDMLKVLQDAAVGNRQESYSLSEAVRVTTEGIRMENSVLSDAAGVQKNISKMYEEHAKKIGKKTDALTQAEKAQAVYNGIMEEASMFEGSAAEMTQGYQGVQAQLNATNLELSRTLGEVMTPTLTQVNSLWLSMSKGLTEFIKNNKTASSGIITLTTGLLATVAVFGTVKTALSAYTTATGVANTITKTFTASLMSNPITLIGIGISVIVSGLTIFNTKMQESIDKMNEATEKSKQLSEALGNWNEKMEFSESERSVVEQEKKEAEEIVNIYENRNKRIKELQDEIKGLEEKGGFAQLKLNTEEIDNLRKYRSELVKLTEEHQKQEKELNKSGKSIDFLKNKFKILSKELSISDNKQKYLTLTNQKAHRETLIGIAQTKADIQGKQKLLNVLKQGKTTTEQYKNAKSQLVKVYPELANVNENTINSTQNMIDAENKAADAEWANAQTAIQASILEVTAMKSNSEQIEQIAMATKQSVEEVTKSLQNQIDILGNLAKLTPDDFKGSVTTNYTPKTTKPASSGGSKGSSSSHSNKKLDNYKSLIEYKKSLDKISLQEEIKMYNKALKEYAKTTEEKRELRTKLYELEKELQEKTYNDHIADVENQKELGNLSLKNEIKKYKEIYNKYAKTTEQKTEMLKKIHELEQELQEKNLNDYTSNIEYKKSLDKLSLEQEVKMYQTALNKYAKTAEQKKELRLKIYELNKEIAERERELLNEQTEDLEKSIEEQKKLQGAKYTVTEQTKDYDKIIALHKKYLNEIMKDERLSLNERKQIYKEELQTIKDYEQKKRDLRVTSIDNTVSQLKDAVTKQLEEAQEKEKDLLDKNLEAVEAWKDARINAINEEYDARIEAIEKELDVLDKAEKQKTRAEEDAEYEKKKLRLEQLIAYEHDATSKANYQKELDKLIAEYQKKLDDRALDDKKEALNNEKNLLKEQQTEETKKIEEEAKKKKEEYDAQLKAIEETYKKQIDKAEETAQKMLMNAEKNQQQILNLLQKYGDAYSITGQTFGEKLGQSFSETLMKKIQTAISNVQTAIDNGIANQIASLSLPSNMIRGSINDKKIHSGVIIHQNNTYNVPTESPSVLYKKQETLNRNLASQISGLF